MNSCHMNLNGALFCVDGLLSQDHGELCQRVLCLEKKVQQQEDEIICLKSALADVIRRLGQVEATKGKESIELEFIRRLGHVQATKGRNPKS